MAIDNSFIIKKLQGLPEMFVIFSQSTKHPYVTCNEESFDDQIHIFSDAEAAHAYVVAKNEQEKILFRTGSMLQSIATAGGQSAGC